MKRPVLLYSVVVNMCFSLKELLLFIFILLSYELVSSLEPFHNSYSFLSVNLKGDYVTSILFDYLFY